MSVINNLFLFKNEIKCDKVKFVYSRVEIILYTSKRYFLRQLPYENTIQYPCKAVKALSNWGKELPSPNFSMVNFVTNWLFQFLPKG